MNKVWIGIAAALLVSACGGKGFLGGNQAAVEQRDLFEKQEAEKKQAEAVEQQTKEKQVAEEQARLKAQLAAQQAQQGTDGGGQNGQGQGAAGEQGEQPVVSPLPPTTLTEQALKESAAAMNDPSNLLSKRSVYFGYDSVGVEGEYSQVVEAHARFLLDHPQVRIRLEGNCDVRGSREYNLALGQKRADGVKRAFALLGVPSAQIESVSFGEEKPRLQGEEEDAHQENRRVDIVYSGGEGMAR